MSSAHESLPSSRESTPTPAVKPLQQAFVLTPATEPERTPRATPTDRLWLCLHLPLLPLEALTSVAGPRAVFAERQGVREVLLADAKAIAAGIGPGLSVNAALALMPGLRLEERDLGREERVLENLAAWAEQFTSCACIEKPSRLLLEIAGSLRLFNGMDALLGRINDDLSEQGFSAVTSVAPTPLAAAWLAKAGGGVSIRNAGSLHKALRSLPLDCLGWPVSVCESLEGMGVSNVGDCLRLPRQGFAKRFGAARLLELDRALGHLPDPRLSYRAPALFSAGYDLDEEQNDGELLLQASKELLVGLERFLLARQMAVQHMEFVFFHLQGPATHLPLGCSRAERAVEHWFELLRIKFDRLTLRAPVIAIELRGGRNHAFSTETDRLPFNARAKRQRHASITHLVERLCARIGDGSVHGVTTVAEHRPQHAWRPHVLLSEVPRGAVPGQPALHGDRHGAPGLLTETRRTTSLVSHRPLWMLQEPCLLATEQGLPVWRGSLELLDGPERLETGWWDGDGIARDYYVARNPGGMRLWVYRDRNTDTGWYLHGFFG